MESEGSPWDKALGLSIDRQLRGWPASYVRRTAKIWNPFKGVWIRVGAHRQAYAKAVEEMNMEMKAVFGLAFFERIRPRKAKFIERITSRHFNHRRHTGPTDAGIQNLVDSKFIWIHTVRNTLLCDLAVQPGLAKTYAILFRNLLNANLLIYERWKDVLSTKLRPFRNALKKVCSMQSRGLIFVSNGLSFFKSASKLAVGMVIIGNTPAVGAVRAIAPEAAEPGSLQAGDFEKSSNFAFWVVACAGTFVAIIAFLKSVNWKRRQSVAGTSAASAPAGTIWNRAVNMAQTHTVLRSWRETEFREVVVARREEEGAYAS